MQMLPIRLTPGQDLRHALELVVRSRGGSAAFVLSGIGSLSKSSIRFAEASTSHQLLGPTEILSLSGTIAANGSHLHMALSTATGEILGGHVMSGCIVRTTAEVLLGLLPDWEFSREPDEFTGFSELVVVHKG